MLGGTFLMLFWKSKCLSIFALTKGWLALETSLESLHGGQFTTSLKLIKPNYPVIPLSNVTPQFLLELLTVILLFKT